MNRPKKFFVLVLAAIIAAAALRLPRMAQRPTHGDEAVQAFKFGELLEKNFYRYNPNEYHGPTLNYLTLIPARLSGIEKFKDLNEFTLRIVPVFFGLLLVLMPLLLLDGLGRPAVVAAIVMTAISPAFVFYSRYYIHEMLLVFFSSGVIVCGWRYACNRNIKWVILTGVFIGLCHATKETSIIVFFSLLLALMLTLRTQRSQVSISNAAGAIRPSHISVAIIAAAAVSVSFYSSFFTNMDGIYDSLWAYTAYLNRAGRGGVHVHPWYYYLDLLTWVEGFEKLTWNEDLIVVMAAFGFIMAMTKKGVADVNSALLKFLAFYTLILTAIYSAIPYKTPWCLLGFLHGMILLAAVGIAALIKMTLYRWEKVFAGLILVFFGLLLPAAQAYLLSYRYYAAPSNPYVYAHPTKDVYDIQRRIEEVSRVSPDGHNVYIQVICPDGDYWPLPWYLRSFPKTGWWNDVDRDIPAAPVIIASPSVVPALTRKLYQQPMPGEKTLYVSLFDSYTELRPGVELQGFVTKELWDSFLQSQSTGQK
ncbi:MAG: TIGR03663 family protein [Sedimentisphaerales bacterium]|nr:TIGR03663 family protein [Sedimentisphaerales bacterium]